MVEVDLSIIFAGLSIAASIVYYASILRNANKTQEMQLETRHAQLYMNLLNRWNTKEFSKQRYDTYRMEWTDLDDFNQKYNPRDTPDIFSSYNTYGRSILGLAELKRKGLIDLDFLDGMMLQDILSWWRRFGTLEKERWERGTPAWYSHFPFIMEVIEYDRKNRPAGYYKDGKWRGSGNRTWVQPEVIMELREQVLKRIQNE
jgi:hypothetical protein